MSNWIRNDLYVKNDDIFNDIKNKFCDNEGCIDFNKIKPNPKGFKDWGSNYNAFIDNDTKPFDSDDKRFTFYNANTIAFPIYAKLSKDFPDNEISIVSQDIDDPYKDAIKTCYKNGYMSKAYVSSYDFDKENWNDWEEIKPHPDYAKPENNIKSNYHELGPEDMPMLFGGSRVAVGIKACPGSQTEGVVDKKASEIASRLTAGDVSRGYEPDLHDRYENGAKLAETATEFGSSGAKVAYEYENSVEGTKAIDKTFKEDAKEGYRVEWREVDPNAKSEVTVARVFKDDVPWMDISFSPVQLEKKKTLEVHDKNAVAEAMRKAEALQEKTRDYDYGIEC